MPAIAEALEEVRGNPQLELMPIPMTAKCWCHPSMEQSSSGTISLSPSDHSVGHGEWSHAGVSRLLSIVGSLGP